MFRKIARVALINGILNSFILFTLSFLLNENENLYEKIGYINDRIRLVEDKFNKQK